MEHKYASVLRLCQLMFMVFCVVFLCVSFYSTVSTYQFYRNAKTTTATIESINRNKKIGETPHGTSYVRVSYSINGNSYESIINEYRLGWYVGEELTVLYDTEDPNNIRMKDLIFLNPILFCFLGIIFFIACYEINVYLKKTLERKKQLLIDGRKVYATIIGCKVNSKMRVNGQYPFRAEAMEEDVFTGEVTHYISQDIYQDPPDLLGKQVLVYVNPKKPKEYYMALPELMEKLS